MLTDEQERRYDADMDREARRYESAIEALRAEIRRYRAKLIAAGIDPADG